MNVGVVSGFETGKKTIEKDGKKTEIEYRSGIRLSIGTNAGDAILSGNGLVIAMGIGSDGKTASAPSNLIKELLGSIPAPKAQ